MAGPPVAVAPAGTGAEPAAPQRPPPDAPARTPSPNLRPPPDQCPGRLQSFVVGRTAKSGRDVHFPLSRVGSNPARLGPESTNMTEVLTRAAALQLEGKL